MKIRLMSDLHTEFKLPYKSQAFNNYRDETVLVLAGDIASGSTNTLTVLKHFRNIFPEVVYVPGNHEYYGNSIQEFDDKMREGCAKHSNIRFLNGDSLVIDGVLFAGATLWTNFAHNFFSIHAARSYISDFKRIVDFTPEAAIELYYKHLDFIKTTYEHRGNKKVAVITHFLPAYECISSRYRDDTSGLNNYFANNLGEYISTLQDTTWMFGHTHDPSDQIIGTTRVVANPRGYYTAFNEGHNFDPYKVVEL